MAASDSIPIEIVLRYGPTERGPQQGLETAICTVEQGRQLAYDFALTMQANGVLNCVATLRLFRGPTLGHWSFLEARPALLWSSRDADGFDFGAVSSKLTAVENQGTTPGAYIPGQQLSDSLTTPPSGSGVVGNFLVGTDILGV